MITIQAAYDTKTREITMVNYTASTHEVAALFPKSAKMRAGGWWNGISFSANAATGERNEAGIKRLRSIIKNAAKHGVEIEMDAQLQNGFRTVAELTAALDAA